MTSQRMKQILSFKIVRQSSEKQPYKENCYHSVNSFLPSCDSVILLGRLYNIGYVIL